MIKNPLLDKEFLVQLDQYPHKETYAKITALSFDELPLEYIEGKITGGSINIDGTSAVRRTCNLSLVANEVNINNFYWGITNKFKLEIGLKNEINSNYPNIIWFSKGIFCITGFNTTYNTNNYSISISGQDKMCMLNGTLGGSLFASIDFGQIETNETIYEEIDFSDDYTKYVAGKYYYKENNTYILANTEYDSTKQYYSAYLTSSLDSLTLKHIIREAVHTYANEPYHNIIINDLDDYGLELLEYRGDKPLYFFFNAGICKNMTYNEEMRFKSPSFISDDNPEGIKALKDFTEDELDNLVNDFNKTAVKVTMIDHNNLEEYTVAKVEFGQTAGYRTTDLVYPGELISSVGETLTSILDKIKNMLGEFEYFYDIDGRFVFQKKKTYVNTNWNTLVKTNDKDVYAENASYTSDVQYSFEDNNLITSFQNNPQLNNLKNDFSVWGVRKGIDKDISVHARYAIDKKPYFYKNYNGELYVASEEDANRIFKKENEKLFIVDWREIIYQMAIDYLKHNQEDDFLISIKNNNYVDNEYLYPDGYTGYEQYYTDMEGFWRQLYDINPKVERNISGGKYEEVEVDLPDEDGHYKMEMQWVPYQEDQTDFTCNYYLPEEFWTTNEYYICSAENKDKHFSNNFKYWHKNVVLAPETLNFWIEFLDTDSEMGQFSVPYIGDRAKSINDSNVSAIYFRETPNIIFTSSEDYDPYNIQTGYVYIWLQDYIANSFVISSQGKSAKDRIDELIYSHVYCTENITLTTIPVYYLEPNARIYVHDEESKINGDYIVSKLTIPLTYNGTMSITATKAVERLY